MAKATGNLLKQLEQERRNYFQATDGFKRAYIQSVERQAKITLNRVKRMTGAAGEESEAYIHTGTGTILHAKGMQYESFVKVKKKKKR